MTKLTIYTVKFCTDIDSAQSDLAATSPQAALAEARAVASDRERLGKLYFEPDSGCFPVNEIVVETPDGQAAAAWYSDEYLLRLAADDLLEALEKAVIALNTARRFKVPKLDTDSYAIATECGCAIARARGETTRTPPDPSPRRESERRAGAT